MKHLENNNILADLQHGFKKHRSCETQLIKTVNDLAKSIRVCHRKLLLKLEHYGIRGRNLQWIKKFLENRTQKVSVSGVIGLLLFLIYINDLSSTVSSIIVLFADDTYIYNQ